MTPHPHLPHRLDRTLVIHAAPAIVFAFFTDDALWASWWGPGSTIDARPGGRVVIRYPNGVEVHGEVTDLDPPRRLAFTYGYASGTPIPAGGSLVTIALESVGDGTRLRLTHEFAEPGPRDQHVQGWRYQLSLFANAVADRLHADAARVVDGWFAVWNEVDGVAREKMLAAIARPDARQADRYSAVEGLDEIAAHIGAAQRFMSLRLSREGDVRQCQGVVLAEWVATDDGGQRRARGTNVFTLDADNRIASVTGFWQA